MSSIIRTIVLLFLLLITGFVWMNTCSAEIIYQNFTIDDPVIFINVTHTPTPTPQPREIPEEKIPLKGVSSPPLDSGVRFISILGEVRVYNPCISVEGIPATLNTVIHYGDYIFVEDYSNATIRMPDGIIIKILNKSELLIGEPPDCDSLQATVTAAPTGKEIPAEGHIFGEGTPTPVPTSTATPVAEQTTEPVTIRLGETQEITLSENPSTGYQWEVSVSDGLDIVSDSYQADTHPPGKIGAGGSHTWMIKATREGKQSFTAIQRRSWEPRTGDEQRFSQEFMVLPGEQTGSPPISPVTPPSSDELPEEALIIGEISPVPTHTDSVDTSLPEQVLPASECSWTGTWDTDFNRMTLEQTGDTVQGTYEHDNGAISGIVEGKQLIGTWSEEGEEEGDLLYVMSADCSSFSGQWTWGNGEEWAGTWNGKRIRLPG